jgi:tRNA pseudouridine55 synthase
VSAPSGLLIVDKPSGPTSHDVVARARRLYATREVGHAGTLDPMATGVLVVLFGEACKLSAHLTADDKRYRAEIRFGTSTDSLDADGAVVEERALAPGWLRDADLGAALDAERARPEQTPPAISAIKVDGVRSHRAARRGNAPALAPRPVRVAALELLEHDDAHVVVELEVSKGYYVRAFARDLAARLGVPAHLSALRRLSSGAFRVDEAVRWPLEAPAPLLDLSSAARRALPSAELTPEGEARARVGKRLADEHFTRAPASPGVTAWLGPNGELVALGERRDDGELAVVRGFRG